MIFGLKLIGYARFDFNIFEDAMMLGMIKKIEISVTIKKKSSDTADRLKSHSQPPGMYV